MKKIKRFFELLDNTEIFLMYLVIGSIFSIVSIIGPNISGKLLNAVIYEQDDLWKNVKYLVGIHLLQVILCVGDQYFANLFLVSQKKKMRRNAFHARAREVGLTREKISSFVSFVNNDIPDIAEGYFQGVIDIIKCLCITIGSAVALWRIHWLLASVIVGCSILIVILPNVLKEQAAKRRKNYAKALEQYNTILETFLEGTDIIKAYLYQKNAEKKLSKENENVVKQEKNVRNCQLCVNGLTGLLQMLKTVSILILGVYLIYIQEIKVGELLAAVQLAELLAAPIEVLAYLLNGRNEAKPLVEEYKELLVKGETEGIIEVGKLENIQVSHLTYAVGEVKILEDLSLSLEAGKKYMLVGKSGSGKTTLLKLLAKLDAAEYAGKIYLNKVEYGNLESVSFYKKIGVVTQNPYMFWVSLEENILLGRSIRKEDYFQIIEELNLSYLLERFKNQPLDKEAVSRLSGGEMQRISLARAMVGKPEIYFLDEVTSSLDEENAYQIEKILLEQDAMLVHACHKMIPALREQYDEIISLDERSSAWIG